MSNFYGATSKTGGATGALDAIDGANLADGDGAVVIQDGSFTIYHLDATKDEAENSPLIISPDSNAGTKRWVLDTAIAYLTPPAGTADAGTAPIKLTAGIALATPEAGAIEYNNNRFCITNVATCRAIDRTSDVAIETVTLANSTVETTLWTGAMPANSLVAGNVFKFHADGIISNDGVGEADEVTLRVKIGGVTKITLSPDTKQLTNVEWHLNANACQRTIGATGSRAIHVHLKIGDPASDGDEISLIGVIEIDTTASMDVTVTAQWASAKAENTISLYQGFMEYKN